MDIKEVYTKLESVENGAEMIAAIKAETNRLSNEAKGHRQSNDKNAAKIKAILENLGLEDADDVADKAKDLKATLDSFAQDGKKPSEVAKQISDLTKQVSSVTKQLADMTATATAEKNKRFDAMKTSALVDALTKGNAASPKDMAKLIADKLVVGDDETITYKDGDKDMSVEEGVNAWLGANTWAVKAKAQGGGGAPAGGAGGDSDPFLAGFGE